MIRVYLKGSLEVGCCKLILLLPEVDLPYAIPAHTCLASSTFCTGQTTVLQCIWALALTESMILRLSAVCTVKQAWRVVQSSVGECVSWGAPRPWCALHALALEFRQIAT